MAIVTTNRTECVIARECSRPKQSDTSVKAEITSSVVCSDVSVVGAPTKSYVEALLPRIDTKSRLNNLLNYGLINILGSSVVTIVTHI